MKAIHLNSIQKKTYLDVCTQPNSTVEVFVHAIQNSKTMKIAHLILKHGRRLLTLNTEQFERGIYIYTIQSNGEQIDFGRIVAS